MTMEMALFEGGDDVRYTNFLSGTGMVHLSRSRLRNKRKLYTGMQGP